METDQATAGRVDKVIHLIATSAVSWEDAATNAITEASATIHDLSQATVVKNDIDVSDGALTYRIKLEVRFRLDRNRIDAAGLSLQVRRYLVVANQTLPSDGLVQLIHEKVARFPCEFHILVPYLAPTGLLADPITGLVGDVGVADALDAARREAVQRLAFFRDSSPDLGQNLTGETVRGDPVSSTRHVMARSSFDEIIVSTLPTRLSHWLKLDVPSRLERIFNLPVTTLIQDE